MITTRPKLVPVRTRKANHTNPIGSKTMSKKTILAVTIATILSTGITASGMTSVFAADNSMSDKAPAKEQVTGQKSDHMTKTVGQDLIKVSDDALISMRDVHNARLAIFNGEPVRAQTYVDAAVTRVDAAVEDADKYALDIKAPKAEDRYVPVDASLTILDDYKPTGDKSNASARSSAKARHIAKANAHLRKGERKEAIETLKLGEIDVAVSTELIPVKFAREHITEAAKLIGDGKYYEANLALKAVDDAAVYQTFAIDATPKAKD